MVHSAVKEEDTVEWGEIIADDEDEDYRMYRSYKYRGIEYRINDSVYAFSEGAKDTDIGKILTITEKKKTRKVKILWFFRPKDICNFLRNYRPAWNELFLACGNGKGLSNDIPLEAIIGKCKVICTSEDSRNTRPSKSELLQSEYFFSHVFDVERRILSAKLPDMIGHAKVERLLNRVREKPKANIEGQRVVIPGSQAEDAKKSHSVSFQVQTPNDKVNVEDSDVKEEAYSMFEQLTQGTQPIRKRKLSEECSESFLKPKRSRVDDEEAQLGNDTISVKPQRPATEQNWFCKLPWEEKIKIAHERRRLVSFINLDPLCTSSDVQEMILFAFKLTVDAKIVPRRSYSSPLYGQALVIFNTMDEANSVVSQLNKKCLVNGNGRPVIAFKSNLVEPPRTSYFPGHFALELLEKKKRTAKAKAISTSHCAQHNTIECQMAVEWILLHEKSDRWCKALHKQYAKEIATWLSKLKSSQSSAPVSYEAPMQAERVPDVKESAVSMEELKCSQSKERKEANEEGTPEHSSVYRFVA